MDVICSVIDKIVYIYASMEFMHCSIFHLYADIGNCAKGQISQSPLLFKILSG